MREMRMNIQKTLTQGLRPMHNPAVNSSYLVQAVNALPRPAGVAAFEHFPLVPANGVWPYPQLFLTTENCMYCLQRDIYELSQADWTTLTPLITSADIPDGGSVWSVADFWNYQVLVNGSVVVVRDPTTGTYAVDTSGYIPVANSVCNFKGRIFAGGLDSWYGMGANAVAWSDIGSMSFKPTEILTPDGAKQTKENLAGYMPVDWSGEVWMVKPLANHVMVYGDSGIASLLPTPLGQHAYGAIRYVKQANIGIASRLAAGGSPARHVFIDEAGYLWTVAEDPATHVIQLKRLGYDQYFAPMLGNDIVVTHDPDLGWFYISDGIDCYVLTDTGLGSVGYNPSGLVFAGSLIGAATDSGQTDFLFVTERFDMGLRGLKTIYTIQLFASTTAGVEVAVDYRDEMADSFTRTSYVPVNYAGVATIPISGVEFRLAIRLQNYATSAPFEINYINVSYKITDERFIRGQANVIEAT